MPVAVGCSGPSLGTVLALADQARRLGAMAAMVAPPTLLRNIDLLPGFYRAIAAATRLPLIVQDEPAATGVTVPVSILLDCLAGSGARTVKLEDPPTPPKIGRLLAEDPNLAVFGGLGGAAALWELDRGAIGTMTGFAYPEVLRAVRLAHVRGDRRERRPIVRPLPAAASPTRPSRSSGWRSARRSSADAERSTSAGTRGLGGPLDAPTLAGLDAILGRLGIEPSLDRFLPATMPDRDRLTTRTEE